jgi:hypothetical protein
MRILILLMSLLFASHAFAADEIYIDWDSFDNVQTQEGYRDYIHGYNSYTLLPNGIKAMFVNPISEPNITTKGGITRRSYIAAFDVRDGNKIYRLDRIGMDARNSDPLFEPQLTPIYFDNDITAFFVQVRKLDNSNTYKVIQYIYIYNKNNHVVTNASIKDVRTGTTIDNKLVKITGKIKKISKDTYKYYVDFPNYKQLPSGLYEKIKSFDVFHFSIKYDQKDEYGFKVIDCIKRYECDGYVSGGYVTPMKISEEVSYK